MNGPNYRHLDRRKRNIYKKYLDYSNKKVRKNINVYFQWCFFKGKLDFIG